jgi:hypothetical protein
MTRMTGPCALTASTRPLVIIGTDPAGTHARRDRERRTA